MQVTADSGEGRFEAVMAHVQSSYLASSGGAVWTRCKGMFLDDGCIRIEEVEVLQVTSRTAGSKREAPVEYVLRPSADGDLCGTYASGCGETGTCELKPVDMSSTLAALEQCVVFKKANVFDAHDHKTYDRIHVGANIPRERNLELFKLLKPGGLLVGPMGDRMVLVTRMRKSTQYPSETSSAPAQDADAHVRDVTAETQEGTGAGGSAGVEGAENASCREVREASASERVPAEEEDEQDEFLVRETMHVRYGDLIVPEKEEEELRNDSQRAGARPPLQGRSAGDMLVCRACCCPIAPADAAEEPMHLGVGEDVRLHGVGSGVLVAQGTQLQIHEDPQRFRKSELGWAHSASCVRCGVFLGLRFKGSVGTVMRPPLAPVQGPGLPEGSLLLPRAFVVRASQHQLQRLELSRAEDIDYVMATSRARANLHSAPSPPDAAATASPDAPVPRISRWMSFGMRMFGKRSRPDDAGTVQGPASGHSSIGTPAAVRDCEGVADESGGGGDGGGEGGLGRAGTNMENVEGDSPVEDTGGDSPMIDAGALNGTGDEEPQGKSVGAHVVLARVLCRATHTHTHTHTRIS